MVSDVAAFLAARVDEDEAALRAVEDNSEPWRGQWAPDVANFALRTRNGWSLARAVTVEEGFPPGVLAHIARHDPARALREVEAKRAIVRRCASFMNELDVYPNGLVSPRAVLARQTLMDLAAVWSGHADYDQDWALLRT